MNDPGPNAAAETPALASDAYRVDRYDSRGGECNFCASSYSGFYLFKKDLPRRLTAILDPRVASSGRSAAAAPSIVRAPWATPTKTRPS